MNSLLWMATPYIALTSFVLGHIWRYRTVLSKHKGPREFKLPAR